MHTYKTLLTANLRTRRFGRQAGLAAVAFLAVLFALKVDPLGLSGNLQGGLNFIKANVDVPTSSVDPRSTIESALFFLISFLALAAVVVIVISGFILVMGLGSEASMTRTKKIFLYTLLGVLIVFFATVIVSFFTKELAGSV